MIEEREKLLSLAERCEAAMGPDQALNRDIRRAIQIDAAPSDFTHSLDAAMTLVPDGWDWSAGICKIEGFPPAEANVSPQAQPFPVELDITTEASTPALALCAAALRARAGQ